MLQLRLDYRYCSEPNRSPKLLVQKKAANAITIGSARNFAIKFKLIDESLQGSDISFSSGLSEYFSVSYYLTDHLGSTAGLTGTAGNLLELETHDSFGNSAGSARTRYLYTGRERDPDSGLMYYCARWQDPQVGRFISEDPIGFRGGELDLYVYVRNNPTRFHDPLGLRRCNPILGGIVGGFGGGVIGGLGGGGLGALGGAGIGCIAGGLGLGTIGTLVEPGGGAAVGGLAGCAAGAATLIGPGAAAGAFVGSGVGIGLGIGAGINYCNGCFSSSEIVCKPTSLRETNRNLS